MGLKYNIIYKTMFSLHKLVLINLINTSIYSFDIF